MGKNIIAACLLLFFFGEIAKADIVVPGEINRQFQISNLNKYPGYSFYYIYQGYSYNMGYHPGKPDTTLVEGVQSYFVSSRGNDQSPLLALSKDSSQWYVSTVSMGGISNVNPSIQSIVDLFEIKGIEKGIVRLKKIKELITYKNGKKTEQLVGGNFLNGTGFTNGMAIVSMVALVLLIFLFFRMKGKPKYVQLTT